MNYIEIIDLILEESRDVLPTNSVMLLLKMKNGMEVENHKKLANADLVVIGYGSSGRALEAIKHMAVDHPHIAMVAIVDDIPVEPMKRKIALAHTGPTLVSMADTLKIERVPDVSYEDTFIPKESNRPHKHKNKRKFF